MSPKRINHRQAHDPVLARYNSFLNNAKFDENGNPFSETVVKISQLPDWTLTKPRRLGISIIEGGDPLRHKNDGPPSLRDMVRRFLNRNLKDLSVEALEAVPWEIMKHIWDDVMSTGQDNLRTWTLFASVYGHEPNFTCIPDDATQQRTRRVYLNRSVPMESLIAPITSLSFKWLVDLDLQASTSYTRFDFLDLPSLPNLGALNVSRHHQDLDIDDGIIRAWAMTAARQGKLTALKVLVAKNHLQVTERALEYLSWIKSLEVVDVTGCAITGLEEIRKLGWIVDAGLADVIDDPLQVWGIMRGGRREEDEPPRLVLQVKVESPTPIPKRVGARAPTVFRRESNWSSTKRKHNNISHQQATSPREITSDKITSTTKKPRVLRDYKKKDMGSLLAEFGTGSVRRPTK